MQKNLRQLQGSSRTGHSGNKPVKSGLHRSGDNNVKKEIGWPHHFCYPGSSGQLPAYQDLSPVQFMVGYLGCIQNETSNTARENMLEYGRHLFQDALETNWTTARHAHVVLLQEIERGNCSWKHPDVIEKIRIRSTARVINPRGTQQTSKPDKQNAKDIICNDYNASTCKHSSDHIVEGQIHKHACAFCYQKVGKLCLHKQQDCLRQKSLGG